MSTAEQAFRSAVNGSKIFKAIQSEVSKCLEDISIETALGISLQVFKQRLSKGSWEYVESYEGEPEKQFSPEWYQWLGDYTKRSFTLDCGSLLRIKKSTIESNVKIFNRMKDEVHRRNTQSLE